MTNQKLETKILEQLLIFEAFLYDRDDRDGDEPDEYEQGWNNGFAQGYKLALNDALKTARKTR